MTATAIAPACPKCGSEMYDNRATKKNPAQPDFKCKRYKEGCDGVVWPPKPAAKAASPKPALPTAKEAHSYGSPEFLPTEESESAELAEKIGGDLKEADAFALYKRAAQFVANEIEPIYQKSGIGLSPEAAAASVQTLFINLTGGKK